MVGNAANITVSTHATEVSLSCEMSLYIHPDENLQWFHDGELINITQTERNISYSFGEGVGQFGADSTQPSRVSTLRISEPQISDTGVYTCAISNTERSKDIELTVVPGKFKSPLLLVNQACMLLYSVFADPSLQPPTIFEPLTYTVQVTEVGSPYTLPGTFSSFKGLGCLLRPPLPAFEVEWILPDQSVVSASEGRFSLFTFRNFDHHNLLLNITRVSYVDEGVYECRIREVGSVSTSWISNTTEILLPGIKVYTAEAAMSLCGPFIEKGVLLC